MAEYPNLAAEMARRGVTARDLATLLGKNVATIYPKLRPGKPDFKTRDAFAIKDRYFPNLTVDYLFATGKEE